MTHEISFQASLPWPLQDVCRGLRDLAWTLPRADGVPAAAGQVTMDLHVPLGKDASVAHRVTVELGPHDPGTGVCRIPVTISATPRFPTFRGAFEASDALDDTSLTLAGEYRFPLGVAGRMSAPVGTGLIRASLRRFFDAVVKTLKADLQATAPAWRPAAMPESLRDR